jgi:hypothetical protein
VAKYAVHDWLADTVVPWPNEAGPWDVALHWASGESGVVCTGFDLRLRPEAAVEAITATRLRDLRLHELVTHGRQLKYSEAGGDLVMAYDDARARGGSIPDGLSDGLIEDVRRTVEGWSEPERSARLTEDHYRKVATIYSTALDAGRNPLRAVIEHPDWAPVSKPTASRWIARARKDGLLPPTGRGRAKGNPALVASNGGKR